MELRVGVPALYTCTVACGAGFAPSAVPSSSREKARNLSICGPVTGLEGGGPPPMVDAIKTWFNDQKIEQFQMYYEKFIDSNSKH